jgi:hypothetical protein
VGPAQVRLSAVLQLNTILSKGLQLLPCRVALHA